MTIPQLEALAELMGLSTEAKECKLKRDILKLLIDHCFEGDADDVNKNAALEACIKPKAVRLAAADDHLTNLVLGHLNDCPDNKDAAKEGMKEHTKKKIKHLEKVIQEKASAKAKPKAKANAKAKGKASAKGKAKAKAKAKAKSQSGRLGWRRKVHTSAPQDTSQQPAEGVNAATNDDDSFDLFAGNAEEADDDLLGVPPRPAENPEADDEYFTELMKQLYPDAETAQAMVHKLLSCKEEPPDEVEAEEPDVPVENLDEFLENCFDTYEASHSQGGLGEELFGTGFDTEPCEQAPGGGSSSSTSKPSADTVTRNYPSGIAKANKRPDVLQSLDCPGGRISLDFQAHRFIAELRHTDRQSSSMVPPFNHNSTSKNFGCGHDWKDALIFCHAWLWRKHARLASLVNSTKAPSIVVQLPGLIPDSIFEQLKPIIDGLGAKINYAKKAKQ